MGSSTEPARRADDASGRVPTAPERTGRRDRGRRTGRRRAGRGVHRHRGGMDGGIRVCCVGVIAAVIFLGIPQAVFTSTLLPILGFPAPHTLSNPVLDAQAHDLIDEGTQAARTLVRGDGQDRWDGIPLPEQEPATVELVARDLRTLPRVAPAAEGQTVLFGPHSVPRELVDTILEASEEAGVDPVYLMALADKESRFDVKAKAATSSAAGLFQFVAATWLELIRDFGARYGLADEAAAVRGQGPAITAARGVRDRILDLRNDPRIAALMAAELVKRSRARIEARVGRMLSATELYLAHLLGSGDAARFLVLNAERPNESAARVFGNAARANRSLFVRRDGAKQRVLTVAELEDRVGDMIDRRLDRYAGVVAIASAPRGGPVLTEAPETAESAPPSSGGKASPRIAVTEALPPDDD